MTNSKSHQVRILCGLKGIDMESEEAKEFYNKTVVELITEIKKLREGKAETESSESEEEEEDYSFASRAGCRY